MTYFPYLAELLLEHSTTIILAIAGFIAAALLLKKHIAAGWKETYKALKFIYKWGTAPVAVLKHLDEQDKTLLQIKGQVFPNGGMSMCDRIDRVLVLAKKAERRSLILAENSPIPTFECDETGQCVWVNTALADLFGMDKSDLLGTHWLKAIHSDDKVRVWNAWQEAIRLRIPYSMEYTIVNQRTGERCRCAAQADIPQLADGHIIFIHGTVRMIGWSQIPQIKEPFKKP